MALLTLQFLTEQSEGVVAHGTPRRHIVTPYVSGVALGVYLTVEEHHRYAVLARPFYGRRQGLIVVGGNNEDVDAGGNETVYLVHPTACIVVGIGYIYRHHIII